MSIWDPLMIHLVWTTARLKHVYVYNSIGYVSYSSKYMYMYEKHDFRQKPTLTLNHSSKLAQNQRIKDKKY